MPIKVFNYAGTPGWYLRKYFGGVSSKYWFKLQYILRRKKSAQYIKFFFNEDNIPQPLSVAIETMNRCNGTCSFCPANIHAEQRPFSRMTNEIFAKIINDLSELTDEKGEITPFSGRILLNINNEPFMDNRIVEFHRLIREKLPKAHIQLYTNGTLLNVEKLREIAPLVDLLIIDYYNVCMEMHPGVQLVYDYVRENPKEFKNIEIVIQMRYAMEVLSNRNGTSPNKKKRKKDIVKAYCLLPYTDINIFPDGTVGICCSDAHEVTCLGSVVKNHLLDIWNGSDPRGAQCHLIDGMGREVKESFAEIRQAMRLGRAGYSFCEQCDFVDIGYSFQRIKQILERV